MLAKLSYGCGPATEPFMYQTAPERLRQLASEDPDRDAFVFYNVNKERESVSRRQLYERSTSLARVLVALGLKKGSTVGFCMNNSINMLLANMAAVAAGGIPFFMATNLKDGSDIAEQMTDLEATMLFMDASIGDENWTILQAILKSQTSQTSCIPNLKAIIVNGTDIDETPRIYSLRKLMKDTTSESELPRLFPEDVIAYFCTSGSTGKPKNVTYTHFSLLNWTICNNTVLQVKPDSVYFCDRSFSWVAGYPRVYLTNGATRVFMDTGISLSGEHIETLCDIIKTEQCDVMYLPGYLCVDLIRHPQYSDRFQNVNAILCGGERMPTAYTELKGVFCKQLFFCYGSTESGGVSAFCSDSPGDYEDGVIGAPVPGMEMKVVDSEHGGEVVEAGKSGQLLVRSQYRFTGYRGMGEMFSAAVDEKNWFHTGDIARMREDGNFVVEGRKQDLISMQNMKYFPWNVERVLQKCPGTKFVAAVGVPDERLTQVICACVVPEDDVILTADDVKRFCDATFVDAATASRLSLKPKHYLIFKEPPRTRSGKLDRRRIAIIARERLGL